VTLTITYPAAGGRVGPGFFVQVDTNLSGPFANDDYYEVQVRNTGTFETVITGRNTTLGHASRSVYLGHYVPGIGNVLTGNAYGANQAASVDLLANLYHANGTLLDGPVLAGGYVIDWLSGMWGHILNSAGGSSSALDDIYNAVHRVYPAT
jgi:hypothetical protein